MITGITFGAFDLLHPGHVVFLKTCKDYCDELTVGLHVNPQLERPKKNKPVQSMAERWLQLHGCKYVDQIIPYETERDLMNIIRSVNFDKRFLDESYVDKKITHPENFDTELVFIAREHDWSSTELRDRIKSA